MSTAAVSLMFTDIEGSTRLWEAQPARMAAALARHDVLCRETVESQHGRVVKMTGDGLYAAFDDAEAALATAILLQQGMQAIARELDLALKLRCGLHAGDAETRDGDYFGPAVNCTARVMEAAHGGQVLATRALVERLSGRRPHDTDLLNLGRVRLRGLASPVDVFQVLHADLRRTFPPLRSLDAIPHNLPRPSTSFIGRDKEIIDSIERLRATNLLTLTGAGGCGKSRLALQVAWTVVETYPDGAWLVELAALADPSLVPQVVASTLGIVAERGISVTDALVRHLESKELLLVLDNAEHLLDACAQLTQAVLRRCRNVKLIVSSRERLGVAGEDAFRVPSLATPDPKLEPTPEWLATLDSIRLFSARAQAHAPQFALTPRNAAAVASVCHRLDGIPLAIELAAARLRSMTVEEVDRRLDQRFRLLTGGLRTALPRQQTLRSLIDWSYELLDAREKRLLARMSVFADGWTIAAAERVGAGDSIEVDDVLDLLGSLVDKNLVIASERDGATRYRLLETMRQYARDRLLETGDIDAVRARHFAFYDAMAEQAEPQLRGPDAQTWLDRLQADVDNLRAALEWSLAGGANAASGLRLASHIIWFWFVRGYLEEGRDWTLRLLDAAPDADRALRARTMTGAGILASQRGDNDRARALHRAALAIFADVGNRMGEAMALNNIGIIAENEGDYAEAQSMYEQCLAILRGLDDRASVAAVLSNVANLRLEADDLVTAKAMYEEALAVQRELGDRQRMATSLNNLSRLALRQGDTGASIALARESVDLARALGDRRSIVMTLEHFASVAVSLGEWDRAARLWGHAERHREDIGLAVTPGGLGERTREIAKVRQAMPEDAFERAWREGRAMYSDEAIQLALR